MKPNVRQSFGSKISTLLEVLAVPPKISCNQGTVCTGVEGLCVFLKRLAYPCRYSDMINLFLRPVPELSILNTVQDFIYTQHGCKITQRSHAILKSNNLERYVAANFR